MKQLNPQHHSLNEVHASIDTTKATGSFWKKLAAFIGPAYLVSVGYMDPGNWATDIAGGSQFGYKLLWVLLMSNLMALLLQSLSARLGIVASRDLAQANRDVYPRSVNFILYLFAEVAIAATDLAEVLGMAIGLQLLTGIPLIWGVAITVLDTFVLLVLQRMGMRKMEAFIVALVFIIGASFFIEIILAKPNLKEVATGLIPSIPNEHALYIAIGIIGATVMPHNLYLHSALVQTRKIQRDNEGIKKALKMNLVDSTIALNLAFLVNAAILVLAATVFFKTGRTDVAEIKQAHMLLKDLLGNNIAPTLFAIALIAAGQSSTITGTLAGQIVMEGYLNLRINPWARRLITRLIAIAPALLVIWINGEKNIDALLILSQVILSLQLGFAIIPLIHFVSNKKLMGHFAIGTLTKAGAWLITAVLVYLNVRMVTEQAIGFIGSSNNIFWNSVITLGGLSYLILLVISFFYPLLKRNFSRVDMQLHPQATELSLLQIPRYQNIAIALDFTVHDEKLLAHALGQGHEHTNYHLIHIVESVPARLLENQSYDRESQLDQEQLDFYAAQLKEKGFKAHALLGYGKSSREIVRLVKQSHSDLLVIGAHGHSGLKDIVYGETVNTVRHDLKIPLLVVNL